MASWHPKIFPETPLPFSRWRVIGFAVTLAMLLLTLGALATRGLQLGLDFTGGSLIQVSRSTPFDAGELRSALARSGEAEIALQLSDGGRTALIRSQTTTQAEAQRLVAAVKDAAGPEATLGSVQAVGPKVSGELIRQGGLAVAAAILAISVYVWMRFEAKFGWAAWITTLHDAVAVIGLFAVTGMSFDLTSIAALLAIAGYSINDTVIVFDRIRETLGRNREAPLEEVIDRAITSTLRRTLATSGTTLMTSVALMLFGGPVLFGFAAAISFGILVGTYSSIFVAAPLLLHLPGRLPARDEKNGEKDVDVAEPEPSVERG